MITRERMEIMAQIVLWVDTDLTALLVTDSLYTPFLFKKRSGNSLEMRWLFLQALVALGDHLHPSTYRFFMCTY